MTSPSKDSNVRGFKLVSIDSDGGGVHNNDALFRLLAENSLTGIWIHEDYIITYANERYAELLGFSVDEVIGMSIWDRVPEYEKKLFIERRNDHKLGKVTTENYEINMLHRNGTIRCMEVFSSSFTYDGRKARMGNMVDITDRKNAEAKLQEALIKVEHVSKAKTEFLANMSHELRTPMTMINGGAEVLKQELFGTLGHPKYMEYAKDISTSGKLLLDLINDLLDTARIDLGTMEIQDDEIDVLETLEMCKRMMNDRMFSRKQKLVIECSETSFKMLGDETRIKQILLNFLTNSIKFTPDGGKITLTARITKQGEIEFLVSDNGIGIPEKDVHQVFEKFIQVENSMTRSHEGAGIGLSLCKDFTELHGGKISIESELGQGTTIMAQFPKERLIR